MSKEKPKFIYKRRNLFRNWFVGCFVAGTAYIIFMASLPQYDAMGKYLWVFVPFALVMSMSATAFWEFYHWQKGIWGENKIEKILKQHGLRYDRNRASGDGKFDYDFIFKINDVVHYLEVKNYSYVDERTLKKHLYWLNFNARKLNKEEFISTHNIKPLLIYVSALQEDTSDKRIMSVSEFNKYVSEILS